MSGLDSRTMPVARITGTGAYLPERIMTNQELESMVDTTDDWIYSRTGMRERRIAAEGEASSDMGAVAARQAIEAAGISPADIDAIIVATGTPDMCFPSTACIIQNILGASNAFCYDLSAACSGFLYGLDTASQYIHAGRVKHALVVGTEKMSGITDWHDRSTCVLFGDGAGAAVVSAGNTGRGVIYTSLGADGSLADLLMVPGGGSRQPVSRESLANHQHFIKMEGREVYKHAITKMTTAARDALEYAGMTIDDVACIIPHQANARIIQAVAQRLGAPMEHFFVNVEKYGNTSAASIVVALHEALEQDRIRSGDVVMMVAFGAGFTWGATLLEI